MKTIKNILNKSLIFMVGLTILTSCLDLDPIVKDKIIPNNFFKNEQDAKAAVTSIYYPFRSDWGGVYCAGVASYFQISNLSSDDMGLQRNDLEIVEKFLWNSGTGAVTSLYTNFVKDVSRATLLIDDLNKMTTMNEELKKRFIAEVRCARAQFMFYLYDFYGTAGVVLDPAVLYDPNTDVIIERASHDDFVSYIEEDLKEAIEVLPVSYPIGDWGRFTKGAALEILTKLYMQEKRWKDAEKNCREIMKLGYKLQERYSSVFAVENECNAEIIWAIPAVAEGGYGNMWITHNMCSDYPLKNNKIQRWNVFNTPWRFYDRYDKNDQRLENLIGEFEYVPKGATAPVLATRENFPHLKKGAIPMKYPEDPAQVGDDSGNDLVVYRYADVLLELAEAINEQNGPTAEAIDLVNQIRHRAGVSDVPAEATSSKEKFKDYILDERGRELYCEGHRRKDLIRHGKFIQAAHEEGYIWAKPHQVLFPLPQNVIDVSKGKITQNPGY